MATPITTTDWIAERVLIVDEDPSAFPAVLLFQEDGSHRLRCSCCPAEDLFVIGESGGRACFHDNRHHRFLIWNIADEVLEATIDEPPRFHSGREVASGFSFIPNSRRYYIVFVRIPILQLRRNNNDGVSFDRDLNFFTSDGDGGQWVSCSIRCPWPYHPYAEPAVEANGFLYWRGSVFSRKIIIRLDCLQLRFDELPLPSSLDFKTARLGFGPDGALALASYNSSPGLLRLWVYSGGRWIQDTRVPFTSKDKSILSMDRGTHWFLPLVFFRGVANEQHRIFLKDNKDVWRFTSTQDGTFRFSLVCETVQCRALPFRPTPVEEPLLKDKEEAEKLDCAVEFADEAEKLEVDYFDQLAKQLESASPLQIIDKALQMFGNDIAIFFSGAEDVALIEYAHLTGRPYRVFSLDTGRLNPETYQFFDTVEKHYGIHIEYMCTDSVEVQALVRSKGLFYFFEDGHQDCCRVRKVRPLRRALKGLRAWITGQRKDQSPGTGSEVPVVQVDPVFEGLDGGAGSLVKWNPLANVAGNDVRNFLHAMNVPVNSLHSQGYISIGCEPCTGSVLPRQHEREGRWLWEDAKAKECGLHKGNLKHEEGQANGNGAANPNGSATADIFTSTEDIKEGRGKSSRERDKVQSSRDRDKLRSSRGRDKLKRN